MGEVPSTYKLSKWKYLKFRESGFLSKVYFILIFNRMCADNKYFFNNI